MLYLNLITNFLAFTCAFTLAKGGTEVMAHLQPRRVLVYYAKIEQVNADDCLLASTLKHPYLTCLYQCFMDLNLERFIFILSL